MVLETHSDASYMNETQAKSTVCKIIKLVCLSTAEAELPALFLNAKEAIPMRQTLINLDHQQPPVDIVTDNAIASGIVNKTMWQNKS